jgi:hypothetical protein
MFEKTYWQALVTSLLRYVLTGVGVWFLGNNIGTEGQWNEFLMGSASLLVSGIWMLYSKSQIAKKIDAARSLPQAMLT